MAEHERVQVASIFVIGTSPLQKPYRKALIVQYYVCSASRQVCRNLHTATAIKMSQSAPSPHAGPRDELDALFDLDEDLLDTTHDIVNAQGNNTRETIREHSAAAARRSEGLGLDEEVKIAKKRQPVAKLDATR
jgi:hypothetical protein